MSSDTIKINLLFNADTSAAQKNMQQLSQLLHNISNKTTVGVESGSLNQAVQSARQLQVHLQEAVNVDTGKIDLSKLNTSLKKSGTDLVTLTNNLKAVGPEGEQAFIKVANAIASAEAPMVKLSGKLKDFAQTMANTVKWQIASNAVHGLQSILEGAVGHAKDLNKALNDIRIVTGYSEVAMEKFANSAAKSAKELSTTTTEYAKAALIFYQQGLTGDEVTERADTVIKLSQVTGQSAQQVSDQMTAIWNNFDDGSKSLEYYADVLAKLGAATAADTQEITDGLSKFAAVADTVGLSYETAAAAVATVVDKTKQSADVVGTSFKTIFARMQGLSLGETLEDGVDLNKYSEALSKVGISVLNAKGEMRDMDDILNELGEKWEGFGETTQIAIAQTVGGIRQYNQMIALMDNWDSVKDNIDLATEATGTLSEQQEIWADSYEAAANRVKEAQNQLYESFISDKALINLNNVTADIIHAFNDLMDRMGGVVPVVLTLAGAFSKILFPLAIMGFKKLGSAVSVWTGKATKDIVSMQTTMMNSMQETLNNANLTEGVRQQIEVSQKLLAVKRQVAIVSQSMTAIQKEEMASNLALYESRAMEIQKLLEKKAALEEEIKLEKQKINESSSYKTRSSVGSKKAVEDFTSQSKEKGYSNDYIEEITSEAVSTSSTDTTAKIKALQERKAQMQSDRDAQVQELDNQRQIASSHQAVLEQKEAANPVNGIMTESGQEHFNKWDEAQQKVQELEQSLQDTEASYKAQQEALDMQIEKLNTIKKLQDEIHDIASKNDMSDISAGTVTKGDKELFSPGSSDTDTIAMETKMASSAIESIGGTSTVDEMGGLADFSVDSSVESFTRLYQVMGEYKTQLNEINAMETDFDNASKVDAYAQLSDMYAKNKDAATEFAAAQEALAVAEDEVSNATKEVQQAEAKLSAALKKGGKNTKEVKKAQADVAKAHTKASQASAKYAKTLSKQPKIFKDVIKAQKPILQSKDKFLEMARSAGVSEKEIKKLGNAFDNFKKTGDPKHLTSIKNALGQLKTATGNTIGSLEGLSGEMREMMLAAGFTDDQIDPIINKLRELSGVAPQAAGAMEDFNNETNKMGNGIQITASGLQKGAETLATFAAQASMAYAAGQSLVSIFDSSASPMERFGAVLTTLTTLLPVVSFALKGLTMAKKENTIEAIKSTIATAKETAGHGLNAIATWAQTAAEVALKIAQNPAVGAVVLGLVLAAGVAMAVYTKNTEAAAAAEQKKNDAAKESAESIKESANAWREQSTLMDDVITKHHQLQEAGKNTSDVLKDLATTAKDLGNAYRDMAEDMGIDLGGTKVTIDGKEMTLEEAINYLEQAGKEGDVEEAETYQEGLDAYFNKEGKGVAEQGANAAMVDVANAMVDNGGAKYKDNKVTRHVGGSDVDGEESEAVKLLQQAGITDGEGKYGTDIILDATSSESFIKDYETLQQTAETIKTTLGDRADNSDTLREVQEMLDAAQEEYETLKAAQEEADKYNVFDAEETLKGQTFSEEAGGETMDLKNIDTLKEYEEYRAALMEEVGTDPVAQQAAQDWLDAHASLSEYGDAKKKIDYVVANKDNWSDKGTELQEYYDSLSDEEKTLFLEVDFDEAKTTEEIQAQIDKLQKEADKAERIKIAEELDLDADELESYTSLLKQKYKDSAEFAEYTAEEYNNAMTEIAVANKRMEKGVKKIADDWDDFNEIMSDSNASMEDVATILPDVNEGLQDILNISDEEFELLPPDFAQKNWDLIQDVVNNVDGAVDKLRDKAGQDILLNVSGAIDADGKIKSDLQTIHDTIAKMDQTEFKVGVAIDPTQHEEFITNCNSMIQAAKMTKEQAEAYFASMGYDVELEEVSPEKTTESTYSYYKLDPEKTAEAGGVPQFSDTATEIPVTSEAGATAYAIKTITPTGSYGGNAAVNKTAPKSATKGKDSGGSKPKKADKVKKTDVVERYKETEDVLDDLRDTLDDVNKATDRLYGASRINQMKKSNQLLQQEIDLLEQKKKEAQAYLAIDRKDLDAAAKTAGVSFTYDENGNISNYDIQMSSLYSQLDAAINAANKDGNADDKEQEKIDAIQEKIDAVTDAIAQYDETKELLEDIDNELDDKFYEWQDQNYEILSYELELKIEVNDEELQKLDYYLNKTEDDFYQRAEGMALINEKMGVHSNNLSIYEDQIAKLDEAYQNGEISQADYIEGMKEITSCTYDNLSSLQELDKQMMAYYGETLQAMAEELDKVTEKIEHQAAVLEHYSALFGLIGRSTDYEKMGIILEGQAEVSKNQMIAAKDEYLNYSQMADEKYQLMMTAETDEAYEMYKQQYEDALAMANEVQDEYLSYAEQYAEQLTAILENSLAKYGQDLENALTGGTSFDQLTSKMERAASLQEEYLTTTNKIYETNKMINTAQQEIDKTTNTVAKQRLKQFINETNQLQKKNKLSQFELDIQQAKYDLLLAEIALEEAQNAKSQVRLQRDSEGNFGYVYTADQDKISQAQQELADAQNNLYNISLEGANGYAEKYQQTLNELYDTLADLQQQYLEGAFESEQEYQNAVAEAKEYYYALLEDYSDLYTIAISTDARVLEDSWSREFSSMVYNTDYWRQQVEEYVDNVSDAFKTWEREMKAVASDTGLGGDFENLAEKVGDITYETEQLTEEIMGPMMASLQSEMDMVNQVTDAYALQREEIAKLILHYEALTQAIEDKQRAEMGIIEAQNTAESAKKDTSNNNSSGSKGNSGNGTPEVGDVVTYTGGKYYHTSGGGGPTGERGPGGKVTITQINSGAKYPIHVWSGDSGYGWLKKEQLSGFDTGGYTGSWGSYGKLAMLHEKELVLNKQDTENLLYSMDLLNNIIQTIDLQSINAQLGGLLNSPAMMMTPSSDVLEQQVTIEANFPNVSSRQEIEEAFSTLVNRASQYANRK